MLGPLPLRHKLLLIGVVLVVGVVLGTWLGALPHVPFRMAFGAVAGSALGAVVAYLLVHQSRPGAWGPHDARLR